MKNWILLDSQSSFDLFCNPQMVTDIKVSINSPHLATNGGILVVHKKAMVPNYGEVCFEENAMTNVFSLANMAAKHRVQFDSDEENAFIMHTPQKKVKFLHTMENLYVLKLDKSTIPLYLAMNIVE